MCTQAQHPTNGVHQFPNATRAPKPISRQPRKLPIHVVRTFVSAAKYRAVGKRTPISPSFHFLRPSSSRPAPVRRRIITIEEKQVQDALLLQIIWEGFSKLKGPDGDDCVRLGIWGRRVRAPRPPRLKRRAHRTPAWRAQFTRACGSGLWWSFLFALCTLH